jgi:MFS family permease
MTPSSESSTDTTPLFSPALILLTTAQFLQCLGFSCLVLFPVFLDNIGASHTEVGWITSAGIWGGLLFRPLVAWGLDHWGRKVMLIGGSLILSGFMFCLGWTTQLGWELYGIRVGIGIGIGTLFATYFTCASDLIPAERRTEGLALFGIFGILPLLVNPVISFFFPHTHQITGDIFSKVSLFILLSIPFALAAFNSKGSSFRVPQKEAHSSPSFKAQLRLFTQPEFWPIWWMSCACALWVSVYLTFATLAAHTLSSPTHLWFGYVIAAVGFRLFGGRFLDQGEGPKQWVMWSIIVFGLAY